ncbi:MAG: hypothetical protein H0W89_01030 [Candidatus Levybacteria bacterium]|nr:hypothetical protein [Candidatus Levybacteria bacterium]
MQFGTLSNRQLTALSDICIAIGQAIFISTVLPFAFSLDSIPLMVVVSGWLLSAVSWMLSLKILK